MDCVAPNKSRSDIERRTERLLLALVLLIIGLSAALVIGYIADGVLVRVGGVLGALLNGGVHP